VRVGDAVVYPLALEAALGGVGGVRRAAFVAAGAGPTVAVEPARGEVPAVAPDGARDGAPVAAQEATAGALPAVRAALDAAGLDGVAVRVVDAIPVDLRHQSKVDRPALVRLLDGRR
jgi:hypothetical protein